MPKFWNDRINTLTPYVPGEQPRDQGLLKLNTNECPYGPSPAALQAIEATIGNNLMRYPDPHATKLCASIAEFYSLGAEQVFVGNGSDEVLAHIFGGLFSNTGAVLSSEITYGFYPIYCRYFGLQYQAIPVQDDLSISVDSLLDASSRCGGIILANPNAATGMALSLGEIARLLTANPDTTVVIDEAYADFGTDSAIALLSDHANLVVVQTCSKSRGLAGLRVGMALGSQEMIEGLNRMKDSFNSYPLDQLAQAGAAAAFTDKAYFDQTRNKIIATRGRFASEVESAGYECVPSVANFLLIRHPKLSGDEFYSQLRERGILVRHLTDQRLVPYVRISIGTDEQMDQVVTVLHELV
ncbi:MAG: histidinol-phosphate transaminase [Proteobacteria bacterium]|jgi:histidinol-phosphate aminotransferase|nr:histidinol-phosphate transaminase [Pseudomonadota bacterium]